MFATSNENCIESIKITMIKIEKETFKKALLLQEYFLHSR